MAPRSRSVNACGVSVATIRFYERRGLLPAPTRRASGVREYSSRVADQVRLVRWLNGLGFSLAEIASLVSAVKGDAKAHAA